ncbi:MAG: hypothetical protein KC621_15300 [Myxococcales bacterium]|nr:hypothetical protein [Myxococcales bacterium]
MQGLLGLFRGREEACAFEALARRTFASNPEALPPRVRDALLPVWLEDIAREAVYVGGRGPTMDRLLIDLPTSHLTGMHFGDHSRWGLETRAADLAAGRFAAVEWWTTHGR